MVVDDSARDLMPLFRHTRPQKPDSPLQLEIVECKPQFACELNALWHSRFPRIDWTNVVRNKDYVCFVAVHDALIYAVAIWSSPVARKLNGVGGLELRRLAIAPDAPKNTASRMLSIMRKRIKKQMPHVNILLSYQDMDVHSGTIYKASGWILTNVSKPGGDWQNSRKRSMAQSTASKARWEIKV